MNDPAEVLVPLAVMASFVIVVALALYFQHRNKRLVMEVIRMTVRENASVSPLLIEAIARGPAAGMGDLRRGCVLLAIAAAVLVFGYAFGQLTRSGLGLPAMSLAAFPGFVGLAYLALHALDRRRA